MGKYRIEIGAFVLLVAGIVFREMNWEWFQAPGITLAWFLLALLPVGLPVVREAWECARKGDVFNEFTLMSIAAVGAFVIGEYPEGVAVMLFYTVGEKLQEAAVERARGHIKSLVDVRPDTAIVVEGEERRVLSPDEVAVGALIEVKAGERVPLDGRLVGNDAEFNMSALTGESLPRECREGEEVPAGSIVIGRTVRLRVIRPAGQSALARVLSLVEEAAERKAPAELLVRRVARIYTPVVTGLALLIVLCPWVYSCLDSGFVYDFRDWLYRGLVFLVISCPCALVVSIPLGYFGGIGAASRLGILFKGGNFLDSITGVDAVVFDKTGTLTRGTFVVTRVCPAGKMSGDELLRLVASVEAGSNHPLAKAVVAHARERGITLLPVERVTELAGAGMEALVDGEMLLVGNLHLLRSRGVIVPAGVEEMVGTVVACARGTVFAGVLLLADTLKDDAREAIRQLRALNISTIQVLSGDKQAIVDTLAGEAGVDAGYGDLFPEGKVRHLEELKRDHRVAFVGDGINDAPVLALSDVGIAMGGLGSDVAIETADVVIQDDRLLKIPLAIRVGRLTRRVVWQNVVLALGLKLLILLLGTLGWASLWAAVFADVGVALLAILNAVSIQKRLK
ncbi:MAG: heavy metal translocating P-type ATPase [Marinifilaceae bacterium]|nr:heavy metal translocating P-type ATPase [Marinifilaceae bacterium]